MSMAARAASPSTAMEQHATWQSQACQVNTEAGLVLASRAGMCHVWGCSAWCSRLACLRHCLTCKIAGRPVKKLDDEGRAAAAKSMLAEFIASNDTAEALTCVQEINAPGRWLNIGGCPSLLMHCLMSCPLHIVCRCKLPAAPS